MTRALLPRCVECLAATVLALAVFASTIALAPSAVADSTDDLRAAVMAVRTARCAPLRSDPVVEQAAQEVNNSTDKWRDFAASAVPVPDPLPLLKDLGYGGRKAVAFYGVGTTDAAAIAGLVLQGYLKIPNCTYTDYGVSVVRNKTTNYFLTVLVLAG